MARIIWSPNASDDLESICEYIAIDSEYYARLFAKRVIKAIERLIVFPESGRIVPEYNLRNIREIIYQNYRIVYRVKSETVEIVTIVHGARLLDHL
ncbi:MAG: type II toxin-antitoxin system RelE/ParE family toxin [Methanosarcinaceae archaeon]|jgi:addiction module RelE/StbE family toxin|nr:type II toxin-antitoxin system RelE/ParE family toxin [Methanosarcinaceae archaeon]